MDHLLTPHNLVIAGIVAVLAGLTTTCLIDRLGRLPLLISGISLMTITHLVLGYCLEHGLLSNIRLALLLLIDLFGFVLGVGAIPWIISTEIFPLHTRDIGITLTTACYWIGHVIIIGLYMALFQTMEHYGLFLLFSGLGLISLFLVLWFIPETRHCSIEQIEKNLYSGKHCKQLGT